MAWANHIGVMLFYGKDGNARRNPGHHWPGFFFYRSSLAGVFLCPRRSGSIDGRHSLSISEPRRRVWAPRYRHHTFLMRAWSGFFTSRQLKIRRSAAWS